MIFMANGTTESAQKTTNNVHIIFARLLSEAKPLEIRDPQGRKVLLYCPRCETPISNFEVAMDNSYREIVEPSVYAKFKVKETTNLQIGCKFTNNESLYILAWTTTPWTLPGNVALAVGESIKYQVLSIKY
jgi:isoleucyl-tRNA synthetase